MRAYWWRPTWPPRSFASELVKHGGAWGRLSAKYRIWPSNFGDALNPHVLHEVTGSRIEWAPLATADVVGVGSVLNAYASQNATAQVFGSGVREPNLTLRALDETKVLGVRGELSADQLGVARDRVIGDPGLVIGSLINRKVQSKGLLVPHFTDFQAPRASTIKQIEARGYRVLPPTLSPLEMAENIAGADHVVTSSLHAIVFADALGVPVCRGTHAQSLEPEFKYQDYRSVFGLDCRTESLASIAKNGLSAEARAEAELAVSVIAEKLPKVIERIYEVGSHLG